MHAIRIAVSFTRAKLLLVNDAHPGCDVGEHSRREEIAGAIERGAAGLDLCPVLLGVLHELADAIVLQGRRCSSRKALC